MQRSSTFGRSSSNLSPSAASTSPRSSGRRSSSGRFAGTAAASRPRGSPKRRAEVDAHGRRLAKLVDEINAAGAEVKDVDTGLIDFPALLNGETVLLCWQLGEDEIRFWHRAGDGFAGRRPLPFGEEE